MDYDKQIDIIAETANAVQLGKVTVLTGKNGSGKSLLRKLISKFISEKSGLPMEKCVSSVSMESRTQRKHEFSAFNSLGIDDPSNPTSGETLYNIDQLVKNAISKDNQRYLVIDEPEIGMGEEMVAALTIKLNGLFATLPEGCLGVLIITHNRYLVKHLNSAFLNIQGLDRDGWLNREIVPTDIEKFKEDALGLYRAVNARVERNKKEKNA